MLSVLAHPELEIAEVAIDAIASLPEDRARLYLDVIMNALPQEVRRVLEAQMIKNYEYRSDFARKYYGQGREEGRQAGLQEGQRAGLRAAIFALAHARLDGLSRATVIAIEALSDPQVLTELVTALADARDAADARAALDRTLRRSGSVDE